MRRVIDNILYLFLIIEFFFLFFRILLRLFGANPFTLFSSFVYFVSDILLIPFRNLFPKIFGLGNTVVDTDALFSLIAYTALIFAIIGIVHVSQNIRRQRNEREGI